jgi:hypothetical protein
VQEIKISNLQQLQAGLLLLNGKNSPNFWCTVQMGGENCKSIMNETRNCKYTCAGAIAE